MRHGDEYTQGNVDLAHPLVAVMIESSPLRTPRRRGYPLSLPTLLVVVLVLFIAFGDFAGIGPKSIGNGWRWSNGRWLRLSKWVVGTMRKLGITFSDLAGGIVRRPGRGRRSHRSHRRVNRELSCIAIRGR